MGRQIHILSPGGYGLIELLFVLAMLGICLAAGTVSLAAGLQIQEARGVAQDWQAASAWAQLGVMWQGGSSGVKYVSGSVAVNHEQGLCGGDLGPVSSAVPVTTNLARWRVGGGLAVGFGGSLAAPDGGGSVYFHAGRRAYRVVVRPESGLTVRSWVEVGP